MSLDKNSGNEEIQKQISNIREAVKTIIKNAKYGSYHDLLRDLAKIETAATKIQSASVGIHSIMRKYDRILVPYDGSRFSKHALSEALEIAKAFNSKLFILAVIEMASDVPSALLHDLINKKLNKLKREMAAPRYATTKLQKQINECKKHGVDVEAEMLVGNAADSILKFANGKRIELIVIGSKGLQGIKKLTAIGSVSRRVSEEAKCPVMIIR